jgi:hypothetical protein
MLMLFFSCSKDIQNITIIGSVTNADTKVPISGMDVTVICWKYGNSPDASYSEDETKVVKTDNQGKYKVNFDKGAFVEVKVSLDGYLIGHESQEIYKKENTINVALRQK